MALMAVSIAAFLGTTSDQLPPMTFFPALVLFAAGALKFLRTNHVVLEKAEKQTQRVLNPVLPENQQVRGHAERQAARRGSTLNHCGEEDVNASPTWPTNQQDYSPGEKIELDDQEDDFVVATDVSFPIEALSDRPQASDDQTVAGLFGVGKNAPGKENRCHAENSCPTPIEVAQPQRFQSSLIGHSRLCTHR